MRPSLLLATFVLTTTTQAQRTIGLTQHDADLPGYVLFSPMQSNITYLIDGCGKEVHEWSCHDLPGLIAQLQPDGTLLRARVTANPVFPGGGAGGIIDRYNWDGDLIWSYAISNDSLCQHHDFTALPNGNILVIAWEGHTAQDAFAHGLDTAYIPANFWSERLIELHPNGTGQADVVWQWRAWDHLVQRFDQELPNFGASALHPRRIDINYRDGGPASTDWLHINSITYNADRDEVMVSAHNFNEVWVIDHGTTIAEAADSIGGAQGHGGDLLYRWGNPMAYETGSLSDRILHHQHNATWLPPGHPDAGKMMVFNNQDGIEGSNYSSVVMFDPPLDTAGHYVLEADAAAGPDAEFWTWTAPVPTDFYGLGLGGATPVGNGFLFTVGPSGQFIGIDSSGTQVWKYINPVSNTGPRVQGMPPQANGVFHCVHYAADFAGFTGHDLTPGSEIELAPLPSLCLSTGIVGPEEGDFQVYPNPATEQVTINATEGFTTVRLIDASGRDVALPHAALGSRLVCDLSGIAPGIYSLLVSGKSSGTVRSTNLVVTPR